MRLLFLTSHSELAPTRHTLPVACMAAFVPTYTLDPAFAQLRPIFGTVRRDHSCSLRPGVIALGCALAPAYCAVRMIPDATHPTPHNSTQSLTTSTRCLGVTLADPGDREGLVALEADRADLVVRQEVEALEGREEAALEAQEDSADQADQVEASVQVRALIMAVVDLAVHQEASVGLEEAITEAITAEAGSGDY
ncbi:unnamed protein product [Peniophora sp. CBMAI 1063]|nr:unnamed protein product [Peniophora sp. CBMAI 1063]